MLPNSLHAMGWKPFSPRTFSPAFSEVLEKNLKPLMLIQVAADLKAEM